MVKLIDVAQRAGVGYGTASRALSGRGSVDEETRNRVLAAAKELGYRPNSTARALREQRTRSVGLIVPDIVNEFYTASAAVLEQRLDERGYQLLVATTRNSPADEQRAIEAMLDRQVDAIVHVPVDPTGVETPNVPVVELNRRSAAGRTSVVSDDVRGVRELTQALIDVGHSDIAVITGPPELSTSAARLEGFLAAATAAGLELDGQSGRRYRVLHGDYSPGHGVAALRSLLGDRPSAIIALSSQITLGVLKEAQEQRLDVPGDLAIASYGDPNWYAIWRPGITTFAPNLVELGEQAARLLLDQLEAGAREPIQVRVPGELKIRGTHLVSARARFKVPHPR